MTTQSVTLPYPPGINHLWFTDRNGRRRLSAAGRQFKDDAGKLCCAAGFRPLTGEVAVTLHFYRPRRIGDVDGGIKIVLDALQGYAYVNDSQIERLVVCRWDDPKRPRVEVTVEEVEA